MAHPPHHGAKMISFHQYRYTQWVENAFENFSDLVGHPLLHLQPPGINLDQPGNFRESNDFAIWDICNMGFAKEGQKMLFAHAEKLYIPDNNQILIPGYENSPIYQFLQISLVVRQNLGIHPRHAFGCFF